MVAKSASSGGYKRFNRSRGLQFPASMFQSNVTLTKFGSFGTKPYFQTISAVSPTKPERLTTDRLGHSPTDCRCLGLLRRARRLRDVGKKA